MEVRYIGDCLKMRRKELNLTQRQVCEGICDPVTLSRLERGIQTPSSNTLNALLQRLGLPSEKYYTFSSANEIKIDTLKKEIVSLNVRFQRVTETDQAAIQEQACDRLHQLEAITSEDNKPIRQFILRTKVLLGKEDHTPYSPEEEISLLQDAVRLTVPSFDLEEIDKHLYSLDEIKVINQIAVAYSAMGEEDKAIDILEQLLKYIQKHDQNLTESAGLLPLVSHNYASVLLKRRYYRKAIEIAERGRRACIDFGHYQFLPGLYHSLALAYHYVSENEKSKEMYYYAYYLYKALNDERDVAELQKSAMKHYHIRFEEPKGAAG